MLDNGKTLSIRTTKNSDKVAPRTVGQAGFGILNEYFADIYGSQINSQEDVRVLIYEHIHEILPVFIDNLFQSDYTVLFSRKNIYDVQLIKVRSWLSIHLQEMNFDLREICLIGQKVRH